MFDLRWAHPDELNRPLPQAVRWTSALAMVVGAVLCFVLAVDHVRNWGSRPHPILQLAFLGFTSAAAVLVAVRLFRAKPLAGRVHSPPRLFVIRSLGALVFLVCAPLAVASPDWGHRLEYGALAVGAIAWLLWPRRSVGGAP